jgi:hypothetical protein
MNLLEEVIVRSRASLAAGFESCTTEPAGLDITAAL